MPTKQLNIRLDEQLDRRREALAARTGRSKAFYAGEAIGGFLDDWEDYYLAKDALAEFRDSVEADRESRQADTAPNRTIPQKRAGPRESQGNRPTPRR